MAPVLLAIETTGLAGGAALFQDGRLLVEADLPRESRSAQSLVPTLQQLLDQRGLIPRQVTHIAVTTGPGSFTGLRVGVVTAKTLAYALGASVVGVPTLEVIAAQADVPPGTPLETVMDAGRRQLFWGRLTAGPVPRWLSAAPGEITETTEWLAGLIAGQVVTGPGLEKLTGVLPADVRVADRATWQPRAGTVGRLALHRIDQGQADDLWTLAPRYLRSSAAEEKAAQRAAAQSQPQDSSGPES